MSNSKLYRLILLRTFLVLAGLVSAVCVAEVAVRISGYQRPAYSSVLGYVDDISVRYDLMPGTKGFIQDAQVTINSQGFRDKEYPVKKDKFRIFVLGSCVTFGHGLKLEKTFLKQLEKKLNENRVQNRQYEVINGGIPGYDGERLLKVFQQRGIKYNPDFLIFHWVIRPHKWHDIRKRQPAWVRFLIYHVIPKMPRNLDLTWFLYDRFRDYKFFYYWDQILAEHGGMTGFINDKYDKSGTEWQKERQSLERLFKLAQDHNIPVLVVIFPWLNYFDENHPFQHIYNELISVCNQNNVKSLNIFDKLKGTNPQDIWLSFEERRPNEQGHKIVANAIYEKLIEEKLLNSP